MVRFGQTPFDRTDANMADPTEVAGSCVSRRSMLTWQRRLSVDMTVANSWASAITGQFWTF